MPDASAGPVEITFLLAWVNKIGSDKTREVHLKITEEQRTWLLADAEYEGCFLEQVRLILSRELKIENAKYEFSLLYPSHETHNMYLELLATLDPKKVARDTIDMRSCRGVFQ